jgi:hypothetical protein
MKNTQDYVPGYYQTAPAGLLGCRPRTGRALFGSVPGLRRDQKLSGFKARTLH